MALLAKPAALCSVLAMSESLQLARVRLRVADLARAREFYTQRLGFVVSEPAAAGEVRLTVAAGASPLLTLSLAPRARAAARDAAGLFHSALLLPNRAALGAWLRFAAERGVEFDGFSDHGVSEAIYLTDPEGNGLEFYADRPRAAWPFAANGELAMVTEPLDVESLVRAAEKGGVAAAMPLQGARWGHLHLRVTDLVRSEAFYRAHLGVALMQGSYPGARFLAADGYHHHLAINTWGSPRRGQAADALGLAEATFRRAGLTAATDLTDPDGMRVRLEPQGA